ncbi:hypothetical protein BJ508DRAFT_410239 [Ascobolus immersus RN42]|uniref:Cytoplasmic protein n=1 Tax=Ascobolus immersus RN42 TaxID=1160509 RepID=A0A3N4IMV9_ASCIM|nr:hypothetical protein BJ508DRAFT_410239 [Ascobolus immersus RN42]
MADEQFTPDTAATLTIRVIKSFPYRTSKNVILHNLDLTTLTIGELKEKVRNEVNTKPGWKAYKACIGGLDTLKLYTKAHGTKTNNLIVNLETGDSDIWDDESKTLAEYGAKHEWEISFFKRSDYDEYVKNPVDLWE